MFFKKKKIYKVEFKNFHDDYGCVVVKATDEARAWKKAIKMFDPIVNPGARPKTYLNISVLKEA